jgi:hypothetical protein
MNDFKNWLATPLSEDSDYKIIDRLLDEYTNIEDILSNQGIVLNNHFKKNFIRFCHLFFRNSRLN